MNCDPLGVTGLEGAPLLLALMIAVALVIAGALILSSRRRGARATLLVLFALALAGAMSLNTIGAQPARAACPPSAGPEDAMSIAQTSPITNLGPNRPPITITGTITNDSNMETTVVNVLVSISGVTLAAGAAPGTCDASDYELLNPSMPVNATLAPGDSAAFTGATLGFLESGSNQDACQGATVQLQYVTT